ncbi:MAG: hypothetical protein J5529_05435 [Prevotella sp.]|nr:hypothetical protein [Prevotella sp.]
MRKTTTAIIRLSRQRIIYDISNNAFVVGETIADDPHARHHVQDVVEGQNRDRVDRVVWLAFCRARAFFVKFLDDREGCQPPPEGRHPEEYVIRLFVPGGLSRPMLDYWAILVYEYVTASAIADWLELTAPEKAEPWRRRMEQAEERLTKSIATKRPVARKRMEVV